MADLCPKERKYPKIWSTFERQLRDGRRVKFQVQNIPEDMFDTVVEFMMGNYIREEVWCSAAGTAKDPLAIEEYRVLLATVVKERLSAVCFLLSDDDTGRTLVGASISMLQKKNFIIEHNPPTSKAGLITLRMFIESMKIRALYDKYQVDNYLMGAGLSVLPEYRGLSIGVELLHARKAISHEMGIRVTGGFFTGTASQRSAELAGYQCCYEIIYKDFWKQCGVNYQTDTEKLKVYACEVV